MSLRGVVLAAHSTIHKGTTNEGALDAYTLGAIATAIVDIVRIHGGTVKKCRQCRDTYIAGGRLGIRANSIFCGDSCRILFNSRKRTK